jgi:hypothetical protein
MMGQNTREVRTWAAEEFGSASLDDVRRSRRLVKMAEVAMNQPAGRVTAVFEGAQREGAFRLLENEAVDADEIARAAHRACARRGREQKYVFVPIDGTSLSITDRQKAKGLGSVGARGMNVSGVQVMTAISVSPDGVPLGLCGQRYWTRQQAVLKKKGRPVAAKETQHWLDVMDQVRSVHAEQAPRTQPWFQLDRGGDAWPIVLDGLLSEELFTVRAAQDRRLDVEDARRYLWETLETGPVLSTLGLEVPAKGQAKRSRTARLEIRAQEISLRFLVEKGTALGSPPLYGLLAREKDAPDGERIEWLLLTNHPVKAAADAELVIFGYSQRWRIEEFHKSWKSGACKVEDTQLRDVDHIIRWATVLASVAIRILRLTYLARHRPDAPAEQELSRFEIDAIILASRKPKHRAGDKLRIAIVVDLLAHLGGYTGPPSGGPAGPLVLARGLYKIESLAMALELDIVRPTPQKM